MKPTPAQTTPPATVPVVTPITVAVVEDDAKVRESFVRLLQRARDFRCVGSFPDGESAVQGLARLKPRVALVDINLPGINGVECVRQLKATDAAVQFVMLTVYEDHDQVFSALAAGATGYLLKRTPPEELLNAVREVCAGGAPMSSQIARKVVESFALQRAISGGAGGAGVKNEPSAEDDELSQLSAREREILDQLAKGYLAKEIADHLGISFDTVRTYSRRIYEKLHVHSRAQAVAKLMLRSGK
jgi:DNA-binding NarL/FixJ family response regulator